MQHHGIQLIEDRTRCRRAGTLNSDVTHVRMALLAGLSGRGGGTVCLRDLELMETHSTSITPQPFLSKRPLKDLHPNLGTNWEPLRPNTGENGGVGPTRKQDESTTSTSRPCLQNLHPRFKSGRRLQNSLAKTLIRLTRGPLSVLCGPEKSLSIAYALSRSRELPARSAWHHWWMENDAPLTEQDGARSFATDDDLFVRISGEPFLTVSFT